MSLQILVTRPGLKAIDDIIVDAGKKFSSLKEELDVPDNSNFSLEMQAEKARDYWLGLDELRNVLIFAQSDNLIPGHVRRGCSVNLEFVDGSVRRFYLSGISDGKKMIGSHNLRGQALELGKELCSGNYIEGDKVLTATILEVSPGDDSFSIEWRLMHAYDGINNLLRRGLHAKDDKLIEEVKSFRKRELSWIRRMMRSLKGHYNVDLRGQSVDAPSLEEYAEADVSERIRIRMEDMQHHPHFRQFARSYRIAHEYRNKIKKLK